MTMGGWSTRRARHGANGISTAKTLPMTYGKWHRHLRVQKGQPSAHICSCGKQAREWALKIEHHVHGAMTWVEDIDAYEPLCVACHRERDHTGTKRSAETRAKISAAALRREARKRVAHSGA